MVQESWFLAVGQTIRVLGHHGRDKVLLLTPVVSGIAYGVAHQKTSLLDCGDVCRRQQLGQIKPVGSRSVWRRQRLKGIKPKVDPLVFDLKLGHFFRRRVAFPSLSALASSEEM